MIEVSERVGLRSGLAGVALAALLASSGCSSGEDGSSMARASARAVPAMAPMDSTVIVGGQPMLPSKTIVDNAVNSADHTTLVAAVSAAGLVDTLRSKGPFTVFAPTNEAFDALPPGTVSSLMEPAQREQLTEVLTYHVVPGRLDSAALRQRVEQGGGTARLETASGGTLTVRANGPSNLVVEDQKGRVAPISTYDVYQSNGVIHVIDEVLLPG